MTGDCLFADEQLFGDGAIRLAGRDEAKYLCLAFAERADRLTRGLLRLLADASESAFGVQLLEQSPRGLDVETPALVITPPLTDTGHQ